MKTQIRFVLFGNFFLTALLSWLVFSGAGKLQALAGSPDWTALCQQTLSEFREITPQDVEAARQWLIVAARELEQRLREAGPEAEGWRKYLLWETFVKELQQEEPRLEVLESVYHRLSAGHEGLGLRWFRQVRQALERFIGLARSLEAQDVQKNYQLVVAELGKTLASYESDFSPENASRIQELLRWLEWTNQAPALREAVHKQLSHPNAVIRVSSSWISTSSEASVDVHEPVRERILGADVRGTGHIVGSRAIRLVPSDRCAQFVIRVEGVLESDTIGYKGPAQIDSHSRTPFVAQKLIQFGPEGLDFKPASCDARAYTDIRDVDVTCRSLCVERLAWRRAQQQKPAAEQEAAWKAERRIARRVDSEAEARLVQARTQYLEKIRQPLVDRDLFPDLFKTQTTDEVFETSIRQLGHSGLASATPAPQPPDADVVVQIHQTFFNNFVEGFFGGMILKEERLQDAIRNLLGELPEELQSDPDEEPWTIRFAEQRPLAVRFADNQVSVEFRGATYWKGDRSYPGMDVKVVYAVEAKQPEGPFQLLRVGGLAVFPPGFDPTKDRLSVRQQTIRRLLERRFDKIFRETIDLQPVELKGEWSEGGPLAVGSITCQQGWLTVALKRIK
ncbi:MAG: hypothetical protein ACUVQG_03225 [Thermogutta sp.]